MPPATSQIPGFRDLSMDDRRRRLAELAGLDVEAVGRALEAGGLDEATADAMVENAIGTLGLPFGVALNFRINGEDRLVPMATEEPSVIAAASHAAKRVRAGGGFRAEVDRSLMAAQIEVHGVGDPGAALARVRDARAELVARADEAAPGLVERGGGAAEVSARDLGEGFVVIHVLVDCCDAMGANALNTVAEALGPRVAELCGGELGLRILSNYCDRRCARVSARVPFDALGCDRVGGEEAARGIASASRFAELDPYRAVTHNKGIMNGVEAVAIATGNDARAIEAAAHAFAARSGAYRPLATWRIEGGALAGAIEIPLALGVVGGALRAHRGARLALDLVGARTAAELAMVTAAAGLATNLAALRALATEGIQRGHMALHHRAKGFGAEGAPCGARPGAPSVEPAFGAEGAPCGARPGAPSVEPAFGAEGAPRGARPGASERDTAALAGE
ncbi:MAG: hydroxymethylglutaryl-CoA reductase, degradative [Polyangiaceae bacterium]|nr:hydroxymethylglutaryl-CoA reductase, degradative [Polyangiaceae bacterium]